jgi:hypothetical protein
VRRHLAALVAALAVLLSAGAGAALADTPTQAAEQVAGTSQSATSNATSTQYMPSNSAVSVRIGSPGNGGSVSQSNSSAAAAAAANLASTAQRAAQTGSGGGLQAAAQAAQTQQAATATAASTQDHPSNRAISVRIGSSGDDGDVSQSNASKAAALAANAAPTTQSADQRQSGSGSTPCGCSGGAVQAADQHATTEQSADATATSRQDHPSNSAISVRIASPGNGGSVRQSNDSAALAKAVNAARTTQTADQGQGSGSGSGVQALEQQAATGQDATAGATSTQSHPSNDATSVRIDSPGDDGPVSQSNDSAALSLAGNLAGTTQEATQAQAPSGCGCGGDRVQAVGQFAATGQSARSGATSEQAGASNSVTPVRIGGELGRCGCGARKAPTSGGGSVSQVNDSLAVAGALNEAATDQRADQSAMGGRAACGCSSGTVQAAGQFADTHQRGDATATSLQAWPSNTAGPVRIASAGSDGSVDQANRSLALGLALNAAFTQQAVVQRQ